MFNEAFFKLFDNFQVSPNPAALNDLFSKTFDSFQGLPAPVLKANTVVVNHLEKLVDLQMSALRFYVNVGMGQLKEAAQISNFQGVEGFLNNQHEVFNEIRQRIMDDAKSLADLGADLKVDLEELASSAAKKAQ